MYSENWTGVQTRIFWAWKFQTAAGRGGAGGVESIGRQADYQRDHLSASKLLESYFGRLEVQRSAPVGEGENTPEGSLSETGGIGEDSEFVVRGSRNFEFRTSDRPCRARRARRAIEKLADFFSIQLP
jgi:hypothetical protein